MIYLDSGVIMRLVAAPADVRAELEKLIGSQKVVTSQVAYIECVCKPIELKMIEVVQAFDAYFDSSDVDLVDVDSAIARVAAYVRANFKLKVPDAIHLATALETKCHTFLTTDSDFERCRTQSSIEFNVFRSSI